MKKPDRYAIVCNLAVPTKTARLGAKAFLDSTSGGAIGDGRLFLLIRSRGGRMIEKWEPIKRLKNFRIATLPPEHPLYREGEPLYTMRKAMQFDTREAAEAELSFILRVNERENGLDN